MAQLGLDGRYALGRRVRRHAAAQRRLAVADRLGRRAGRRPPARAGLVQRRAPLGPRGYGGGGRGWAPARPGAPLSGFVLMVVSAVFGLATAVTLAIATGLRWPQRQVEQEVIDESAEGDDDQESARLGMIVHPLLSWKARIGRVLRGGSRSVLPAAMPARTLGRQEPRFDSYGRSAMPHAVQPEKDDEEKRPAPRRRTASPI